MTMKNLKTLLLLLMVYPMAMVASAWDTEYKQIEKNIKAVSRDEVEE